MGKTYFIEEEKRILVLETDVFVAGAGTSGMIAAIAAARNGAQVVLIEKLPVPGGTLTNGGIGFNAYYSQETETGPHSRRIVGGLPYELAQRLENTGNATGFAQLESDHYHIPYRFMADHEALKAVASEMLLEAGITVLLQTFLAGIVHEDGKIKAAIIENKNGRSAVIAKQYIDSTGDGDIAKMMDLQQMELWQDYHTVCGGPTGLVFGMAGIDFEKALRENDGAFRLLSKNSSVDSCHLSMERYALIHSMHPDRYPKLNALDINYFTSFQSLHEGEATYINNSKAVNIDATIVETYSQAELVMRSRIMKMAQALRKEVPGFENGYINWASIQLGVRASWITKCDYMLTQQEISNAVRFEDEIGLYGFHDYAPQNKEMFTVAPGFYGLPYRMLLPVGAENLFMTGRSVTFDIMAHMSTRNTVSCMVMGQGAGTAAALCALRAISSRELEYSELKAALIKGEVILD